MIYITNEARSAELDMIISYPASPSRVIVLLKTLRHIIQPLGQNGLPNVRASESCDSCEPGCEPRESPF